MDFNRIEISGRLGKDPEMQGSILLISVCNKNYKNENTWFRVSIFNEDVISFVTKSFRKGSKVFISGYLSVWRDKNNSVQNNIIISKGGYVCFMPDTGSQNKDYAESSDKALKNQSNVTHETSENQSNIPQKECSTIFDEFDNFDDDPIPF